MRRSVPSLVGLLLLGASLPAQVEARVWKDVTGFYTIEADLVGFDDKTVILQRANKELGACPIEKLSAEDREYLKTKTAMETHNSNLGTLQTWTLSNGVKFIGRIVDYAQRDVTVQRRRGKLYANDKAYDNLPPVYQRMLMAVVQHQEQFPVNNKTDLDRWLLTLKGQPKTYPLEGVVIELENGDEYSVPFFLFADQDRQLLEGGYDEWLADQKGEGQQESAPVYTDPNEHQIRLQSLAAAYQQDQQINRQIAMMNLNMQAIQSGLTSAWEVTLYPGPGNPYPPRWVVTMGRNSEIATQIALQQNPGFVPGPVRKVSN